MSSLGKLAGITCAAFVMAGSAFAQQINVEANKSTPFRVNGKASSVVIGNPTVADVAVHSDNLLFITGRTSGTTNLLIFNEAGQQLYSGDVVVSSDTKTFLSVNRAGQNNTYDCAPRCNSVIAVGDDTAYFERVLEQNRTLKDLAAEQ